MTPLPGSGRCRRLGVLLAAAIVATAPRPLAAQMNLAGSWRIELNRCETVDGQPECTPTGTVLTVSQAGSRLSGVVLLPPDDIPAECDLTCTPDTPNCRLAAQLDGTITGLEVAFAITARQTVAADCGICTVQGVFDSTIQARGTLGGGLITGTFTEDTLNRCTGTEPCLSIADCADASAAGTFVVRITGDDGGPCVGDCSRDGRVTIDELVTSVSIALDSAPAGACPEADLDANGAVTVAELVAAVRAAINGCSGPPPDACELGDPCESGLDCPFVACPDGPTFACYYGRCLIGSCACSDDPQCCQRP